MTAAGDSDVAACRALAEGLPVIGESGAAPKLMAGRCTACGTLSLPAAAICPNCWAGGAPEPAELSHTGTLYTYTVVRNAPPGFQAPYMIGYVDLPEGLRVMARREGEPPADARPDVQVRLFAGEIVREEDGTLVLGPCFAFANEAGGAS